MSILDSKYSNYVALTSQDQWPMWLKIKLLCLSLNSTNISKIIWVLPQDEWSMWLKTNVVITAFHLKKLSYIQSLLCDCADVQGVFGQKIPQKLILNAIKTPKYNIIKKIILVTFLKAFKTFDGFIISNHTKNEFVKEFTESDNSDLTTQENEYFTKEERKRLLTCTENDGIDNDRLHLITTYVNELIGFSLDPEFSKHYNKKPYCIMLCIYQKNIFSRRYIIEKI